MDVWLTGKVFNLEFANSWDLPLKTFRNIFRVHLLYTEQIKKMMNFFMLTTNFFIWPDIKT